MVRKKSENVNGFFSLDLALFFHLFLLLSLRVEAFVDIKAISHYQDKMWNKEIGFPRETMSSLFHLLRRSHFFLNILCFFEGQTK